MCSLVDRRGVNIFQAEAGDVPLREPGKINVTFTPRVFPTPTRESVAPEEEAVRKGIRIIIITATICIVLSSIIMAEPLREFTRFTR